jgi:hypothetical protein
MDHRKLKAIAVIMALILSLSCSRVVANLAGPQGPVEALTQYAVPLELTPLNDGTPATESSSMPKSAPEIEQEPAPLIGKWAGDAQWLCDNNPSWTVVLNFDSDGTVTATVTGVGEPITQEAPWVLIGNDLHIDFDTTPWVGTLSGDSITGTFGEESCKGTWTMFKK